MTCSQSEAYSAPPSAGQRNSAVARHDASSYPTKRACARRFEVWRRVQKIVVSLQNWEDVLTSGVIALLTGPHQISFSEVSSFTIRLSEGDRPVFAPEYADSAPEAVIAEPVS